MQAVAPKVCHRPEEEMHRILGSTLKSCPAVALEMQTGLHSADIPLWSAEGENKGGVFAWSHGAVQVGQQKLHVLFIDLPVKGSGFLSWAAAAA